MKKLLVNGHYLSVGDFVKVRYVTPECPAYNFEGFVTKLQDPDQAQINDTWFITTYDTITEHVPCSP